MSACLTPSHTCCSVLVCQDRAAFDLLASGRQRADDPMPKQSTVRLVEVAEILGVTKQRVHQIAEEKGFPAPLCRGRPRPGLEPARGAGVCEAMARRETVALVSGEDRSDLWSLKGSLLDKGATDGLDSRSVRGHDRFGFSKLRVDEGLDILDHEALGDPPSVRDVVDIASPNHPPVEELFRGDAREIGDGLAFEVVGQFVSPRPHVREGVLGSSRPQCHVSEGESEDDSSDGVTSLMRGETRRRELVWHGSRFAWRGDTWLPPGASRGTRAAPAT